MHPVRSEPAHTAGRDLDFKDFFDREQDRLGRALFLLTGDSSEAEDLAQDALVRVFERWTRVRRMESPTGYLYRVAMNLHHSRLRRLAVRVRSPISAPPPADPATTAEDRDAISRALSAIPQGQRAALVLVAWLGMSDQEAGGVLRISPGAVRVRVSRGRSAFRSRLEDDDA
jgi:RNA polymerase sigma-70 factor (sigma-E family)